MFAALMLGQLLYIFLLFATTIPILYTIPNGFITYFVAELLYRTLYSIFSHTKNRSGNLWIRFRCGMGLSLKD